MIAPDPAAMLEAWERGLRQPLQRKVIGFLAAAIPETTPAEIAALPLGARDRLLFDLRERLFGPDLATVATCPGCGERLEAGFSLADVRVAPSGAEAGEHELEAGSHHIRFRLPATSDLLAIPAGADEAEARDILLRRTVIEARDGAGDAVDPADLPAAVAPAIAAGMASADPQAVVDLSLTCPACAEPFEAAFDIASFLAREVDAWAQQTLRDVHALACAFGWRESDILALSPTRRQIYLDLVAG